jgi:hypothetical protein
MLHACSRAGEPVHSQPPQGRGSEIQLFGSVSILAEKRELRLTLTWHYKIPHTRSDFELIVIDKFSV